MARKKATPAKAQPDDGEVKAKRPLLGYLRGALASLKPSEQRIAKCVLADPEKVLTSSIAEFRESSGASVGSIIGFCRTLGLKGFAEFKIALSRDLALSGLPAGNSPSTGSVLDDVFQFHTQNLADTIRLNTGSTFEQIGEALQRAKRIELFSIGLSFPVAYTASCKLGLIGLPASAQFDPHIQLINASQLKAGDVAFGISSSGTTREIVQCLEVAKANGATTICITNAMQSPVTACSDLCLYATPSEIKYFQAPLASRVTQLALIDAIFVFLAQKNKNRTASRLQSSAEALAKRRVG